MSVEETSVKFSFHSIPEVRRALGVRKEAGWQRNVNTSYMISPFSSDAGLGVRVSSDKHRFQPRCETGECQSQLHHGLGFATINPLPPPSEGSSGAIAGPVQCTSELHHAGGAAASRELDHLAQWSPEFDCGLYLLGGQRGCT